MTLRITDAAEDDLAEIWASLAQEASPRVADRLLAAIETAFDPLRMFPLLGPARDKLGTGLRVTFHSPYAIYYLVDPEALVIVRVIHLARDVDALAERGGFA